LGSTDKTTRSRRAGAAAAALILGALSFLVHEHLERRLERLAVLEQVDVLFDADPVAYLREFRDGEVRERRRPRHLNVRNTIHPLVRLVAGGATAAGLVPREAEGALDHQLALLVAPAAAGVTTVAVFCLFLLLGASMAGATMVALLELVSFSGLVFGSMPESYPLSGAVLGLTFLLGAYALRRGRLMPAAWVVLGALAFGFTTTNLGLFAMPLFFVAWRLRGSAASAVRATAGACALAVLAALAQFYVVGRLYGEQPSARQLAKASQSFVGLYAADAARSMPRALAATFLPSPPGLVESEVGIRRGSRYRSMFTTMRTSDPWPADTARIVLVLGFAIVGSRAYWRGRSTPAHPLFLAALASLGWNALVHAFFLYTDLFLYSKHWEVPLLVLVGGCALQESPVVVALTGFTAASAVNNAVILRGLLRSLEAVGR
jgi:hypothetical protein